MKKKLKKLTQKLLQKIIYANQYSTSKEKNNLVRLQSAVFPITNKVQLISLIDIYRNALIQADTRKTRFEQRVQIFLTVLSFYSTGIFTVQAFIIQGKEVVSTAPSVIPLILVLLTFLFLVYIIVDTIALLSPAHEYFEFSESGLISEVASKQDINYYRKLLVTLGMHLYRNSTVLKEKFDYMTRLYKRLILYIIFAAITVLLSGLIMPEKEPEYAKKAAKVIQVQPEEHWYVRFIKKMVDLAKGH